jgi:glycosyl transferase family 25
VGCFLSHRLAWQRVVRAQRPLLIFEDDVVLSENLVPVLAGLTPSPGPVVYNLETGHGRKLVSIWPTEPLPAGHATVKIYRDSGGSAAYLMTPQAAAICLDRAERYTAPADAYMNNMPLARLQIEPGLAVQMDMLEGLRQGELRSTAASTMQRTYTQTSVLRKLVRRPRMKLRRLDANLQTAAVQVMTLARAKKRVVPYCPTIAAKVSFHRHQSRSAA